MHSPVRHGPCLPPHCFTLACVTHLHYFPCPCRYIQVYVPETISTTGSRSQSSRTNINTIGLLFGSQIEGLSSFVLCHKQNQYWAFNTWPSISPLSSATYSLFSQNAGEENYPRIIPTVTYMKKEAATIMACVKKLLSFVLCHSSDFMAKRRSSKWPGFEPGLCHLLAV